MVTSNRSNISDEIIKLYDELIASAPGTERKGATVPYTSMNGNMFSFLDKQGLLSLRMSEEDREAFVKKYKSKPSFQYGIVMKEYVLVPEKLLKNVEELKPWFVRSHTYAKTLKSKPTKKK